MLTAIDEDSAMRRVSSSSPPPLWPLLLVGACLLGGCASTTTVTAIHSPLYAANRHTSTIEATATNTAVGIRRIVLRVTTGEMTDCAELGELDSVIPCRRNASEIVFACNFAGRPVTATCTYSQNLGDRALVTYLAEAQPAIGDPVSSEEITYTGGFPAAAGMARPVWWHRGERLGQKIDLGFFPDDDYLGEYLHFTTDLERIAKGAFFSTGSGQDFAQVYTRFRPLFNLWAAPFGADAAEGCTRSFDPVASRVAGIMDGQAIVHTAQFRDCASLGLGGSGSISNTVDGDWVLMHESGHFLHGQGDEYCCDGGYAFAGFCGNVFASQPICQVAASSAGAPQANCVPIESGPLKTGAWRNTDGSLETMAVAIDTSNWRDNSSLCVLQRFVNCGNGSCY